MKCGSNEKEVFNENIKEKKKYLKFENNKNDIDVIPMGPVTEVGIQCSETNLIAEDKFFITDIGLRRRFVRMLYAILMTQFLIAIPTIEIFLNCLEKPIPVPLYQFVSLMLFIFYALLNTPFCTRIRRVCPMNYVLLVIITFLQVATEGAYASTINSHWVLLNPAIIIVELTLLILYTKQTRFKLTVFRGVFVVLAIFVIIYIIASILLSIKSIFTICMRSLVFVSYIIYDTQLMLSFENDYKIQPDEHVFAAASIYIDIPKMVWALFKALFLDHIIMVFKYLKTCFKKEVC